MFEVWRFWQGMIQAGTEGKATECISLFSPVKLWNHEAFKSSRPTLACVSKEKCLWAIYQESRVYNSQSLEIIIYCLPFYYYFSKQKNHKWQKLWNRLSSQRTLCRKPFWFSLLLQPLALDFKIMECHTIAREIL